MQKEKNAFLVLPLWPAHRSPVLLAGVAEHLRKLDMHATETLPTEVLRGEVHRSSSLFCVYLNVNQVEMLRGLEARCVTGIREVLRLRRKNERHASEVWKLSRCEC